MDGKLNACRTLVELGTDVNARDVSDTVTVVLTIRMAILPSACVTKVINYETVTSLKLSWSGPIAIVLTSS